MPTLLFFHASTNNRRWRNKIFELLYNGGNVFWEEYNIKDHILHHFITLYTISHIQIPNNHFTPILDSNVISSEMRFILDTPLRDTKNLIAIKFFKPMKEPGLDGLHPMFHQKFWLDVGPKINFLCKEVFSICTMRTIHNNTLLCLIPKCRSASILKSYKPIESSPSFNPLLDQIRLAS